MSQKDRIEIAEPPPRSTTMEPADGPEHRMVCSDFQTPAPKLQTAARRIALLTGGGDKPYALGIAEALTLAGWSVDFIGSDDLRCPEILDNPRVKFLNLRGDLRHDAGLLAKVFRVLVFYARLFGYAAAGSPNIFHVLWNNKFEYFDATLLMLYYRCLGKTVVFTAHNVNGRKRDGTDNWLNRFCLWCQYRLSHHIFVHTQKMKEELAAEFGVPEAKTTVIPFGINNTLRDTGLAPVEAKRRLGLHPRNQTMLFFGRIAPYKGLGYLIDALGALAGKWPDLRLVIVGVPKVVTGASRGGRDYWEEMREKINQTGAQERVIQRIEFVPDEETELFFKAADVLVLPYTHIFQSGVLFLGYNFGLPVIAADVGSLKEEIVEGKTGIVCQPCDPADLARAIHAYFSSDLYAHLENHRQEIRDFARERYSWSKVARMTTQVYAGLSK